jgi:hypothetical protein
MGSKLTILHGLLLAFNSTRCDCLTILVLVPWKTLIPFIHVITRIDIHVKTCTNDYKCKIEYNL